MEKLNIQKCSEKACGARVALVNVEGEDVPVNPIKKEFLFEREPGKFQWTVGFQPHRETCVNISNRPAKSTHS